MSNRFAILNGLCQGDLDMAGHHLLNFVFPSGGFPYDVKNFGAVGDGTADDTAAIHDARDGIPSTGGVLYFPAGRYKYTDTSPLVLDKPITVLGDGGSFEYFLDGTYKPAVSSILFNNPTGTLFQLTVGGCSFIELMLDNPAATPTDGAAILQSAGGLSTFTKYLNLSIAGFFDGISVVTGAAHRSSGGIFLNQARYAMRLRNTLLPDSGDHIISDGTFLGKPSSVSAIRIESGGGPKIINNKVIQFVNGIDLAAAPGIATSDLLVCNNSLETISGAGIKIINGSGSTYDNILLTANQILAAGNPFGILIDGTGGPMDGVFCIGNRGSSGGSSNPFMSLTNCTGVVTVGNGHLGFNGRLVTSGVTFADTDAVRSQPTYATPATINQIVACLQAAKLCA